jgi:hypothetical protein
MTIRPHDHGLLSESTKTTYLARLPVLHQPVHGNGHRLIHESRLGDEAFHDTCVGHRCLGRVECCVVGGKGDGGRGISAFRVVASGVRLRVGAYVRYRRV